MGGPCGMPLSASDLNPRLTPTSAISVRYLVLSPCHVVPHHDRLSPSNRVTVEPLDLGNGQAMGVSGRILSGEEVRWEVVGQAT